MKIFSCFLLILGCFLIEKISVKCERISVFKKVTIQENGSIALVDELHENLQKSRFLIAVTVKDNSLSLPTFLATLEEIECPNSNKKCDLW